MLTLLKEESKIKVFQRPLSELMLMLLSIAYSDVVRGCARVETGPLVVYKYTEICTMILGNVDDHLLGTESEGGKHGLKLLSIIRMLNWCFTSIMMF